MKQVFIISIIILFILAFSALAEEAEFDVDPGITPDNPFYFLDVWFEWPGDNPEKALDYKEEKVAEARAMDEKRKAKAVQQALEKASQYGAIVEKEVTPEMQERVTQSSEAVEKVLRQLAEETKGIEDLIAQEGRTKVAAQISFKIKELCDALAGLDPVQYAENCKTGEDAPKWQKELHRQHNEDLEREIQSFVGALSACFSNPSSCDCSTLKVYSLEQQCSQKKEQLVLCQGGDDAACQAMMLEDFDPAEFLSPELLQQYAGLTKDFSNQMKGRLAREGPENFLPPPCRQAGVTTMEECEQVMFRSFAPPECVEAGATNRAECTTIYNQAQFEMNADSRCVEAGISTKEACMQFLKESSPSQKYSGQCDSKETQEEQLKCLEGYFEVVQAEIVLSGTVITKSLSPEMMEKDVPPPSEPTVIPMPSEEGAFPEEFPESDAGDAEAFPGEAVPSEGAVVEESNNLDSSGNDLDSPENVAGSDLPDNGGRVEQSGEVIIVDSNAGGDGGLITGGAVAAAGEKGEVSTTTQWFWMTNYLGLPR